MLALNLRAVDFLAALQALLPRGRVWRRGSDAVQTAALNGIAPAYERQTQRANYLLVDAYPLTTYELLSEWESTLGLPDPCAGVAPSIQARRAQVAARIQNTGGSSVAALIAFAASLGYTVTIEQFTQARAGMLHAGDPDNGYDWNFAFRLTAPLNTVIHGVAGGLAAGDPLASWTNKVLECELRSIMPAHTIAIFAYV